MKTTLNLDDDLMREVKEEAATRGTTMTTIVEEALRERLRRRAETEPYVWRPVTVRGNKPPPVDPADRAALYELLDDDLR